MAEFPYLPLATDAYLADTTHLSTEEHGAYLLLLMATWRASECRLPDDDAYLARACRCSTRAWGRIRPVLAPFWHIAGGWWSPTWASWRAADWMIHSSRILDADWRTIRNVIIQRDGLICRYCGDTSGPFEIDHQHPRSHGGTNDPANLCVACRSCNRSKSALTVEEWLEAPR